MTVEREPRVRVRGTVVLTANEFGRVDGREGDDVVQERGVVEAAPPPMGDAAHDQRAGFGDQSHCVLVSTLRAERGWAPAHRRPVA